MGIFNKKTATITIATTTVVVAGGIAALIAMGSGIELVQLSITPHKGAGSVDVTTSDSFVTCAMTLTDTDGVKHAVCALASPTSSQTSSCIATTPSSGTVNDGVWICNVLIPMNTEPGEWFVQYLSVTDLATPDSNSETIVKSEIEADVCPSGCVITSTDQLLIPVTSPSYDNLPPNVLNFVATTNPIPLLAAGGTVTCDPSITDLPETGQSGLNDHTCTLTSPDGTVQHSCRGALANPCDVDMAATLEEGVWPIYITVRDNSGNSQTYPSGSIPGTQSITVGAGGAGGAGGTGGTGGTGGVSCDPAVELTATNGWSEQDAGDPAGSSLTFSSYVRMTGEEGYVAVSDQAMTDQTQHDAMAMGVRFSSSGVSAGFFDARDGTGYGCGIGDGNGAEGAAACDIPWVDGTWYLIVMTADVAAETYTVQVGECGEALEILILNANFRNFNANDNMTHYNLWAFTGTTDLADAVWTPGACVPLTCADYGLNSCGTPPDGCAGTLNCDAVPGTCATRTEPTWTGQVGDVCDTQYQCCRPLTVAQVCTAGGYECGDWSDGCLSTVNCGSCSGAESCDGSGQCVTSSKPNANNTGPTDPGSIDTWANQGYGSTTITTSGGTYVDFLLTGGQIRVEGDNNTFSNCIMTDSDFFIESSASNTVIEDCELGDGARCLIDYGTDNRFSRVYCHDVPIDGIRMHGVNGLLEDSFITRSGVGSDPSRHVDLVQMINARGNTRVTGNNILGHTCSGPRPYRTATLIQIANSMTQCPIVDGNWLNGVDSIMVNGGDGCSITLRDNFIGDFFHLALWGSGNFNASGNVWECDGSPVPNSLGDPLPACAGTPWPGDPCP